MKLKLSLLIILTIVMVSCNINNSDKKFIDVTGSSEMEVLADEITIVIGIEEYWLEEFKANKKFKDYKTKVKIGKIEEALINDLKKFKIDKEQVVVRDIGNRWRYRGKEFLISKEIQIAFTDFELLDSVIKSLDTKGISKITIGNVENLKITEYKKSVKIDALKAAKEKAQYLLESINEELGDAIEIIESESSYNAFYLDEFEISNNEYKEYKPEGGINNFKKIKLKYKVKVKFGIK